MSDFLVAICGNLIGLAIFCGVVYAFGGEVTIVRRDRKR